MEIIIFHLDPLSECCNTTHYTVVKMPFLSSKYFYLSLKADRPHPRDYQHMPTDYRHTDKHIRLVMTLTDLCCQTSTHKRTDRQVDRRTDGRYQVHYLSTSRSINITD